MNDAWAAQNIQVIRSLMERSALYRRALAPVSLAVGALGLVAGITGWWADIDTARGFALLWAAVAVAAFLVAFVVMRRQAIQASEPFWSPPARRVAQAMLPAMFGGLIAAVVVGLPAWRDPLHAWWLPGIWMLLFGAATHAAGFFMPRGIKLVAWAFAALGAVCLLYVNARMHAAGMPALRLAHLLMGAVFGGLHLLYGIYLALTEQRSDCA
ncbi:MAG: hypothetical protein JNK85_10695 [Verrucomicrobiales bacterium]|nr:hypothetical protein [Verrucomicrobiales bacterium]